MAKTIIRKHLIVLTTGDLPRNTHRGIEFDAYAREIFSDFVTEEPRELVIVWNNKFFLRRGTHTTRKSIENNTNWLIMSITRYVEVDWVKLSSLLIKQRHQPENNPYAAVLGDKSREHSQIFPIKDEDA